MVTDCEVFLHRYPRRIISLSMQTQKPFDAAVKAAVHSAAIDRANAEPDPGPLSAVYALNTSIDIKDSSGKVKFSVRPFVDYDVILLKQLNSFIYREQVGDLDLERDIPGMCELCLLFTTPHRQAIRMLRKDKEAFEDLAWVTFFENKENRELLVDITTACLKQINTAFSTSLQYGQKETEEKGGAAQAPFLESKGISGTEQRTV